MAKSKRSLDNYVPPVVRLVKFKADHKDSSVETEVEVSWEKEAALVRASLLVGEKVIATGHSLTTDLDEEKALEKAETAAVGRALVNAGYLAEDPSYSEEESEEEEEEKPKPKKGLGSKSKSKGLSGLKKPKPKKEEDPEEEPEESQEESQEEEEVEEKEVKKPSKPSPKKGKSSSKSNLKDVMAKYGLK